MSKERKEIIEKLRNVKHTATENLLKDNYEKNTVVQNVKYYGKVNLKQKDSKQVDSIDLYTVEIYSYDTDAIEKRVYLDGQEADIGELLRTYEDINPIKDIISKAKENQEKDNEREEYSLKEIENEKIREYAGAIGKEKEKIEEIDELELDQELKEESKQNDTLEADIANHLTKREETNLDQKIKGVTLRNALGLSGEYTKIAIVSSSQVNQYTNPEKSHHNIDSFVAVKANGETTVLEEDIIRQDRQEGINSTSADLTANVNGEVDYEQNKSSYQIVNSPNLYLKVGYDENHGREIKVEDRSREKGKEGIVYELETSNTWRADDDVRRMQGDKEGIYAADNAIEEQEKHEKMGCENNRVENIDQYEGNDIHQHVAIKEYDTVPGKKITFKEWANDLGEGVDTIIERFQREQQKNPNKEVDDIVEEIEDDYDRLPDHKR